MKHHMIHPLKKERMHELEVLIFQPIEEQFKKVMDSFKDEEDLIQKLMDIQKYQW